MGFYPPATLVRDAQRRGVEILPPDVNLSGARCEARDGRCASGSATSPRSARPRRGRSSRSGSGRAVRVAAGARPARAAVGAAARGADRRAARATNGGSAGRSCGSSGSCRARPRCRERAARSSSSRSRSTRRPRRRSCPSRRCGSGCSPTTARHGSTVGVHPLELLRPHLAAGTLSSLELLDRPHGSRVRDRRARGRTSAAGDRERGRVHAPRGRARPVQPDRAAAGVRAVPGARARGAARRGVGAVRAGRAEPEPARQPPRDARPARAPDLGAGRRSAPRCRRRTISGIAERAREAPRAADVEPHSAPRAAQVRSRPLPIVADRARRGHASSRIVTLSARSPRPHRA